MIKKSFQRNLQGCTSVGTLICHSEKRLLVSKSIKLETYAPKNACGLVLLLSTLSVMMLEEMREGVLTHSF